MREQTMTGPARLRQIAEFTILSAAELRQLAALWEADLSYAAGLIADEILRAERAEAALDRATNDLMLSEESFVKMRDKRDDVLREKDRRNDAFMFGIGITTCPAAPAADRRSRSCGR